MDRDGDSSEERGERAHRDFFMRMRIKETKGRSLALGRGSCRRRGACGSWRRSIPAIHPPFYMLSAALYVLRSRVIGNVFGRGRCRCLQDQHGKRKHGSEGRTQENGYGKARYRRMRVRSVVSRRLVDQSV